MFCNVQLNVFLSGYEEEEVLISHQILLKEGTIIQQYRLSVYA